MKKDWQKIGAVVGIAGVVIALIGLVSGVGFSGKSSFTDSFNQKPQLECDATVTNLLGFNPIISEGSCIKTGRTCSPLFTITQPLGLFSTSGKVVFQTSDDAASVPITVTEFTEPKVTAELCTEDSSVLIKFVGSDGEQVSSKQVSVQ